MLGRKKSITLVAVLLVVMLVLSVAGCAKKTEPPAPNQPTTPAPQKVEIVMAHPFAAQHPVSQQILLPLAKELNEKSNGRITLTIHAGGSVTSPATIREDVATGTIDMGWTLPGYTPGKYPLTDVVELPFLFDSTPQASYVIWQLVQKNAAMQKEYGDVKVIALWTADPGEILSQKLVKKPEDLKGMKIRFGGGQEPMVKKFGGEPVGMAMPQVYDALDRKILDGVSVGPSVIESYKLNEVIKYTTKGLNSFYGTQVIFMNKKKYDSLSAEDKKLFDSLTGDAINKKAIAIYSAGYNKGMEMAKASKVTITEISPTERQVWVDKSASVVDEWVKKVTDKGMPGKELLDEAKKLAKEYKP